MDRRSFLKTGLVATAAMLRVGEPLRRAFASPTPPVPGQNRYGPLGVEDANGIRLPAGFTSREIARAQRLVPGTAHLWHELPDGGATFATGDGGWIYVSNSERGNLLGGVGAIRFDGAGEVIDAYPILLGTRRNCAGGPTPWGTWLSCEEIEEGAVYECDPTGDFLGVRRPALGGFSHEAAVVDPVTNIVYLTEDESDGKLYRFVPDDPTGDARSLASGRLEAARVAPGGAVDWLPIPTPFPIRPLETQTRYQVPATTSFDGGEGAWFDIPTRTVYFTTKGDDSIWALDVDASTIERLYHGEATPGNPLQGADNITVSPGGDLYVCEDHSPSRGALDVVMLDRSASIVSVFASFSGIQHAGSELTGVAFSPAGDRVYLSSQRAYAVGADVAVNQGGATYEITGPF